MALSVSTDHQVIAAELGRVIDLDPVRHTMLGTIRISLEPTAWLCWHEDGLAVRSSADYPVAVAGDWPVELRGELCRLLREVPELHELSGQVDLVEALAGELAPGRELVRMAQRLFRLDELAAPAGVPGR